MLFTKRGGAARESAPGTGWLSRLRRDTRGNTLAIVGAALVPLAGMIGSGVDMSRAYMAKTRLQSACDAAALAARRVMQDDTMTAAVQAEGTRFFNFNFQQGLYNTATFTPAITRPTSGTVRVTASTTIPTSIMRLFGFTNLPLNVTCDASLNFVNTDVMLVLDVTGSMAQNLAGTQKMVSLRDAVMALYDELAPVQTQLEANGLRLRYGVVPYSSTVNVGALIRGANPAYLADTVTYQSRVANYTTPTAPYIPNTPTETGPTQQTYGSSISQTNCTKYGQNTSFSGFSPTAASGGGPAPTATWTRTYSNTAADWGWSGAGDTDGDNRSCRRRYMTQTTTYSSSYRYTDDIFREVTVDTSSFKTGAAVNVAMDADPDDNNDDSYAGTMLAPGAFDLTDLATEATGVGTRSVTWNGCIEERETADPSLITTTAPTSLAIPSTAYDLNINLIPSSPETRWRPQWPEMAWYRTAGSTDATGGTSVANAACPAAARRLQAWTRTAMQSYVNALIPTGSTYHDIGMLWGARMISSGGIFADSPDNYASMPVARHIIFMSDGQMDTDPSVYGAYGMERNDMRISGQGSPSESELNGRHTQRFRMICNAAKSMNVSIWVIAFGTTLSTDMAACASNSNQASTISNRDQLIDKFREIGNNIGALRLTQ